MIRNKPAAQQIVSFKNLPGGIYGSLVLLAITPEVLEVRLGADFVRLSREEVKGLGRAALVFLELGRKGGRKIAPPSPVSANTVPEDNAEESPAGRSGESGASDRFSETVIDVEESSVAALEVTGRAARRPRRKKA